MPPKAQRKRALDSVPRNAEPVAVAEQEDLPSNSEESEAESPPREQRPYQRLLNAKLNLIRNQTLMVQRDMEFKAAEHELNKKLMLAQHGFLKAEHEMRMQTLRLEMAKNK